MTIELYSIMNFYTVILTIAGFILPALIIYFYVRHKTHIAFIASLVLLFLTILSVGDKITILLPFILPILFAGAAGSLLRKYDEPFWPAMGYVVLAELVGVMVGVVVIYFTYGRQDIAHLIAQGFQNVYQNVTTNEPLGMLNLNLMTQILMISTEGTIPQYAVVEAMSVSEKVSLIVPQMKTAMANALPGAIMGYGIISGVWAWFLSSVMMARAKRHKKTMKGIKAYTPHPSFSSWKMPRWMTNVLMAILLVSIFISYMAQSAMTNVASAMQTVAMLVLSIQGLSVVSWWLNKKTKNTAINVIICVLVVIILSFALPWIGLIDIIFSVRMSEKAKSLIKKRMEEIKKQAEEQMHDTNQDDDNSAEDNDTNDNTNASNDESEEDT